MNVFIYTYGRVGSTAILKLVEKYIKAHHFHNIEPYFNNYIKSKEFPTLNYFLENNQIKVITGVRNPIDRSVSAFFTWMLKEGSYDKNRYGQYANSGKFFISKDPQEIINMDIDYLINKFLQVLQSDEIFDIKNCWFDNNIKKYFDINVYDYILNNKHFIKINYKNVELLIYKQEGLLETGTDMLKDFLNISDTNFYLEQYKNSCLDEDWSRDLFLKFKNKLDKNNLKYIFNQKVRHFYSQKEIDNFINEKR